MCQCASDFQSSIAIVLRVQPAAESRKGRAGIGTISFERSRKRKKDCWAKACQIAIVLTVTTARSIVASTPLTVTNLGSNLKLGGPLMLQGIAKQGWQWLCLPFITIFFCAA